MQTRIIAAVTLAFAQLGCSNAIAPRSAEELRSAPLSVTADGKTLVLEPFLWRDFMPVSPPDGKPLVAILRLRASDGSAPPSDVHIDAAWVVNGREVWTTGVGEERVTSTSYEVVARNGPKWGPGVAVDVIVRVRDSHGTTSLLRAANQLIGRTD
jgi:hypothetical protein